MMGGAGGTCVKAPAASEVFFWVPTSFSEDMVLMYNFPISSLAELQSTYTSQHRRLNNQV
jgi:hypothetical protein